MMDDAQLAEIAKRNFCGVIDETQVNPDVDTLFTEVTRLRAESAQAVWLTAEVKRLRGIVAAVEALPEKWRAQVDKCTLANCVVCLGATTCADELSAALGEQQKEPGA